MQTTRLQHLLIAVFTLLLLVFLAVQSAGLFWRLWAAPPTISVPTITPKTPNDTPWLANVSFKAEKAQPAAPTTVSRSATANSPVMDSAKNWRLKGVYAETGDSIAIIQTNAGSRVLEVGDVVAEGFVVTKITPTQVLIRGTNDELSLQLENRHLAELAETTYGAKLPPRTSIALPKLTTTVPAVPFKETEWLQHLVIKPIRENGQAAFEIAADNSTGEGLLRGVGLQSGDIVLAVDGQAPTPQAWRSLATKLRNSQKIRAKIKRHGTIQTITIQQ